MSSMMEDPCGLGKPVTDPKDAKVDIVFVHGLNGNRITTWTSNPSDENPDPVFWPKDLLPSKCPNARIFSYGYNASIAHFYPLFGPKNVPPTMSIGNHSSALLDDLVGVRSRTDSKDRPLIFVAHSLGGLVCADAVSKQLGVDNAKKDLVAKVCGMIFLGTPFAGSKQARWAEIAIKLMSTISNTNENLVKDLEERSKTLAEINSNFTQLVKARDRTPHWIEIACYFEGLPTIGKRKGSAFIVDKDSATLPGIAPVSIEKNHVNMPKFDGEYRPGFISISDKLSRWIQDLDRKDDEDKQKAGGINIGSTNYHAPITRNDGVVAATIFSTQKDGLRTVYYGSQKNRSRSDQSESDNED
ncbi:uncharacterized protein F4807DRAFT_464190 [Annulohypoxylon truncatum]|uniref:uncharacterized protein n=1 Tax=Annulohypoxylon truncatum TaxID=327061 RepID=UPI00200779B2|nr:uncharacterized protein F4807DRAFT_464190 [Annulohypoxylon truncatum]KAI1205958.1 hypothetical protein F4807DRAFT_464190 [Annulohypoxylon truncatum]